MAKYGPPVVGKKLRREFKRREHEKMNTFAKRLYYPFFKRTADIVCSTLALIVFLVFLPILAIIIKLDSPGPVFFSQIRVGQYGRLIKITKFRTMRQDAEAMVRKSDFDANNYPFIQKKGDDRVTRVGKFLRMFSIDELPQIFSVFKGDMSFIGPRPFISEEVSRLKPEHLYRLVVKPGLTGLAQISGRNNLNLEQRIEKDLYYIDHMSAWLDIKILFITIIKVLTREGAN